MSNLVQKKLKFVKLSECAYTPTKSSPFAAGYDIYSAQYFVVPAYGKTTVRTDLSIQVPVDNLYRIVPI